MASITTWTRLEPRPREEDLARSLRAQVRDPAWMLARQWQFGEFGGENAASAIRVEGTLRYRRLDRYADAEGRQRSLPEGGLLEAEIEAEPVSFDLRTRVQAGQQFLRLLDAEGAGGASAVFRRAFPIDANTGLLDVRGQQFLKAVQGRVVDGGALLRFLDEGGDPALPEVPEALRDAVRLAATALQSWFTRVYVNPASGEGGDATWIRSRLEYRLGLGTDSAGTMEYVAEAHRGGRIDWYAFDQQREVDFTEAANVELSVVATSTGFRGMAPSRWWEFEDDRTDFGSMRVGRDELGRLLFMEMALIYGEDWSVIPCRLPVGVVAQLESLVVTDVFGRRTTVRPAAAVHSGAWCMFTISGRDEPDLLLIPPTPGTFIQGRAIEDLSLQRDEASNLVWAVENQVEGGLGQPLPGAEAAIATGFVHESDPSPADDAADRGQRWYIARGGAAHWIPLIPVRHESERAVMLEVSGLHLRWRDPVTGDPVEARSVPRGRVLGAPNDDPSTPPLQVHPEEVPRAGRRIRRRFNWGRDFRGRPLLWIGRHKGAGRPESSTTLRFDVLTAE